MRYRRREERIPIPLIIITFRTVGSRLYYCTDASDIVCTDVETGEVIVPRDNFIRATRDR